jgi:hypothetical protein
MFLQSKKMSKSSFSTVNNKLYTKVSAFFAQIMKGNAPNEPIYNTYISPSHMPESCQWAGRVAVRV